MATYTEHYNLIKPALNDKVNINNLNDNADIIDTALNNKVNTSDTQDITTSANKCMLSDGVTSVEDAIPLIRKGIFQVNGAGTTPVSDTMVFSSPFPTATDIVLLSVRRDAADTSPQNGVARVKMYSKNQFIYTFTGNNGSGYYVDYIAFGH